MLYNWKINSSFFIYSRKNPHDHMINGGSIRCAGVANPSVWMTSDVLLNIFLGDEFFVADKTDRSEPVTLEPIKSEPIKVKDKET